MKRLFLFSAIAVLASVTPAMADDAKVFEIVIKDHKFEPARIEVPADEKFKLLVKNKDTTAEEFESHDFKREKVISGGEERTISVGPLKPGEYKFYGEFNPKTAQGVLVAK